MVLPGEAITVEKESERVTMGEESGGASLGPAGFS